MAKQLQHSIYKAPASGRLPRAQRAPRGARTVSAKAEASAGDSSKSSDTFSLAPSAPVTPYGEMMAYYLKMEPALFETAVDDQFNKIKDQRDQAQQALEDEKAAKEPAATASTDLVLSGLQNRVQGLAEKERQATVEDLMYLCILREFMKLNVNMLPKMDNYKGIDAITLDPLMGGVHSKEALELVREHMMNLLGQTQMMPPEASLKMSKLQMVQVYGASVMFGYFLRRADSRFQLAKRTGMLPENKEEAVARLERLFAMADTDDDDPDTASPPPGSQQADEPSAFNTSEEQPKENKKGDKALRKYIESFDQQTMRETATIMTREGASLLDRQTKALWGDASELQSEMQQAIGLDVSSMEEVMKRAEKAVANDEVATVTMSIGTQRRAVLEAVAFGTFLRDVESEVDTSYGLLTALPVGKGPDSPPTKGSGSGGDEPPGMLPA